MSRASLRAVPLFEGLSDAALDRILEHAAEVDVAAGTVLVQPNQKGSGLFVIEEGSATVERRGGQTIELGPGEFFGELALLDVEQVRTARVRAKTDLRCLAINRSDFLGLLESEPRIAIAMLKVLAQRMAG